MGPGALGGFQRPSRVHIGYLVGYIRIPRLRADTRRPWFQPWVSSMQRPRGDSLISPPNGKLLCPIETSNGSITPAYVYISQNNTDIVPKEDPANLRPPSPFCGDCLFRVALLTPRLSSSEKKRSQGRGWKLAEASDHRAVPDGGVLWVN